MTFDDRVRISKHKNIVAKCYTPNCSEEVFVIKKVENTLQWTYVVNDLNSKVIIGTLQNYKKNFKTGIKKNLG